MTISEEVTRGERTREPRAALDALREIGAQLTRYTFRPASEADLQTQVTRVLRDAGLEPEREVRTVRGAFDIRVSTAGATVVLELKLRASAAEVERQAQRYALTAGVDAVAVVTTSQRLAMALVGGPGAGEGATLGGKPFRVFALRGF